MEKKRVLLAIRRCVNKGPVQQTYNILSNISMEEFEPVFLTMKKETPADTIIEQFKELPMKRISVEGNAKDLLVGILFGRGKIADAMVNVAPKVIHTTGFVVDLIGVQVAKRIGCKHIATIRNYVYDDYLKKFGSVTGSLMARVHLNMFKKQDQRTTYVCCSESLSRIYKSKHQIDLPYIRNGVNTERYCASILTDKMELRKKLGLPNDKRIYVTVAQVIPRKRILETIHVFQREEHADKLFVVVGDGSELTFLKEQAINNENIIFVGKQKNVEEWLMASDIFVSSSESEGLPNSVIEAMATGLPVILSDIEQHKEIFSLNSKIGMLYTLGNEDELCDAVSNADEEWSHMCSPESAELARGELSGKRMSEEYQKLYMQM